MQWNAIAMKLCVHTTAKMSYSCMILNWSPWLSVCVCVEGGAHVPVPALMHANLRHSSPFDTMVHISLTPCHTPDHGTRVNAD